jgi:hypothetical protein
LHPSGQVGEAAPIRASRRGAASACLFQAPSSGQKSKRARILEIVRLGSMARTPRITSAARTHSLMFCEDPGTEALRPPPCRRSVPLSAMGLGRAKTRRRVRPVERSCSAVRICATCAVVFTGSRSVEKSDSHQWAAYQRFHTARVTSRRGDGLVGTVQVTL